MIARHVALGALLLALTTAPAFAVTLGAESEPPASGEEDDYARGATAFEREDWPAVIDHMTKATAERPWHDDAYNLMGFAYRKLGDYDKALPVLRSGARAQPASSRCAGISRRGVPGAGSARSRPRRRWIGSRWNAGAWRRMPRPAPGRSDCEEWQELSEAYEAYVATDGK